MTTHSKIDALFHRARIGKFVSVGAVGAAIETCFVAVLTAGFGIPPLAAKAVGAEVSISTMFVINDRWTFVDAAGLGWGAFLRRWGKSHFVRAFGLGVGFAVLFGLTSGKITLSLFGFDIWPTVANIIGIGFGMVFNYIAESLFTWDVADTD